MYMTPQVLMNRAKFAETEALRENDILMAKVRELKAKRSIRRKSASM